MLKEPISYLGRGPLRRLLALIIVCAGATLVVMSHSASLRIASSRNLSEVENAGQNLLTNIIQEEFSSEGSSGEDYSTMTQRRIPVPKQYHRNDISRSSSYNETLQRVSEILRTTWSGGSKHFRKLWPKDLMCKNLTVRFIPKHLLPPTALASFPGSGNTWLRYLIEGITGIFTGSVYQDRYLYYSGFYGEFEDYLSGNTVVQKTHDSSEGTIRSFNDSGILLIRNPFKALLSFNNYLYAGHTGHAPPNSSKKKGWKLWVESQVVAWRNTTLNWLHPDNSVIVVHYETMKIHLERELRRIMAFLRIPVNEDRLQCVLRNPQGGFKRGHSSHNKGKSLFAQDLQVRIQQAIKEVTNVLRLSNQPLLPLELYEFLSTNQ